MSHNKKQVGLPVLNNYPGWLADIITQNQCGLAIPPGDAIIFADSLINLKDNPNLIKEMGINASHLAREKFDRNDLGAQFVDVLESLAVK